MINFINKYKQAFTVTGAVSVLIICYLQQKELAKLRSEKKIEVLGGGDIAKAQTIDSLQHLVDSLDSENYPCQIEKNRYEVAFKIFAERNPKAAEQYAEIISSETE